MPAVVRLRSAVCLLGRFPALAGVDLDVAAGEIVLLSGANGAGKTTLLRLLAGLVPLYSGEADGARPRPRRATGAVARRELALVGHETFCYDDLTVRENLRFAARAVGARRRRRRRRARAARARRAAPTSRTVGCRPGSAAASRSRSRWSRDPRLLLLDEPHAGLDADGRAVLDDVVARRAGRGPHGAARVARARRTPARSPTARSCSPPGQAARPRVADRAEPRAGTRMNLWQEARLVAGKDLRIEARSRVTLQQILPFGADRAPPVRVRARPRPRGAAARRARAVLGRRCCSPRCSRSSRAFAIEADNGARDGLRLSGLDGAAIFLGKAAAIAVELLVLEVVLAVGVVVLYDVDARTRSCPLVLATLAATVGLAATGTLYGVLAAGLRVRETLVPVLLLPVVAPVLLGATRAWEAAIDGVPSDAWPWVGAARRCSRCCSPRSGCSPSGRSWRKHERAAEAAGQRRRSAG